MSDFDRAVLSSSISWGRLRTAAVLTLGVLVLYGGLLLILAALSSGDAVRCFLVTNFVGVVGVPSAIIASLGIVALLSSSIGGEFRIQLWGLKLEGPSAPITMWAVCFLVMVLAIHMLFPAQVTADALAPVFHAYCEGGN
ncbi:MAG TPA: hypothetical protein VJ984_04320 [Xanthomonadales bacterium]|nr:hypothetical protein [Xanthomonadales bacterium]